MVCGRGQRASCGGEVGGGGWGSGKGQEGTVVPDEKVFRPQPCPASDIKVRVEARGRDV